jgi:hypothetical protein
VKKYNLPCYFGWQHTGNIFLMNSAISLSELEQYRISLAFVLYHTYRDSWKAGANKAKQALVQKVVEKRCDSLQEPEKCM